MNEFHEKYGNGKKWYLNPENYRESYMEDPGRQEYVREFYGNMRMHDARAKCEQTLEEDKDLDPTALEQTITERMKRQKEVHYGQVVPIEELEEILRMSGCIMRFGCLCRYMYEDGIEFRSCYVVAQEADGGKLKEILNGLHSEYLDGEGMHGVEIVSTEEAIRHFREMDRMGLIHTVWTLQTPFIASICNCDPVHCSSMYTTVKTGHTATLFMGDEIAVVDRNACIGCRRCKMACQYGAIEYSAAAKKVQINPARCIGCGTCRAQCNAGAIRLVDRESDLRSAGKYEMRDRQR